MIMVTGMNPTQISTTKNTFHLFENNFVRVQMNEDSRLERTCLPALHSSLKLT